MTPSPLLKVGEGCPHAPRAHRGTKALYHTPAGAARHSLVLHLGQGLAHGRVFDVGVRQGLQDVLLGGQVLFQVDLDLVVLLQLLLKEFLPREGRI